MKSWQRSSTRRILTRQKWVALAKRAGQKYLVITAKHHDGFCLLSRLTPLTTRWKARRLAATSLKRLAEECARQGMKFAAVLLANARLAPPRRRHRPAPRRNPGRLAAKKKLKKILPVMLEP